MNMKINSLSLLGIIIFLSACTNQDPNLNEKGEDILEAKETYFPDAKLSHHDTVYVPIYSDIYHKSVYEKFLLTATLSIRNTSLTDSIFINDVDYYDTDGKKVRNYLSDKQLLLRPMQSIEYVIEEDDDVGGSGANFIINWGATTNKVKPIFQGVMISTHGQQGISFITEGVSIR